MQHAHNPVDWYPWGEEALQRALHEDKPILVSIGYAACHWCHVMERESFEDADTAALMNEHFINIKIDREERPDLDHIYMDAVQAMSGSGGWPLNVFLTPDKRPFYGGTYFPPVKAFNRPSWKEVLGGVLAGFRDRRHEIDAQAENLTDHLVKSNSFGLQRGENETSMMNFEKLDEISSRLMSTADTEWGGFGRAPKFPQTFSVQFLLRYHHLRKKGGSDNPAVDDGSAKALRQALLSLDRMIEGGIYDQVGGGFSRYSTDTEWLAPHFEKMLYDNALLVSVISEAYQLSGHARYREVIDETMEFVQRELMNDQGGFHAALDADSEGVEGKFYVWQKDEIDSLLGKDANLFCRYYDISDRGNWEEKNILRVKIPKESVAAEGNIALDELNAIIDKGRLKLLEARERRIRPALDDKMILGWNALMNTACSKAFAATGKEAYRQLAIRNMRFVLETLSIGKGEFHHTWKGGEAKYPAFLDDYAFLVQALVQLQEVTGDQSWLVQAREIMQFINVHFSEPETGFYFYTKEGQGDVIVRKKEVYDGAVPSGNAVMAENLHRLGILFDEQGWRKRATEMVLSLGQASSKYPGSFGCWNNLLLEMVAGTLEIAIVGENFEEIHAQLLREFIPNRVLMAAKKGSENFPLLSGKEATDRVQIYLCKDFSCRQPVDRIDSFISLINSDNRGN